MGSPPHEAEFGSGHVTENHYEDGSFGALHISFAITSCTLRLIRVNQIFLTYFATMDTENGKKRTWQSLDEVGSSGRLEYITPLMLPKKRTRLS